jgi:hypothetical protein
MEDPAYPIIRKAIKKRKYHLNLVKSYSAKMYMKSNVPLDEIPKKFIFSFADLNIYYNFALL